MNEYHRPKQNNNLNKTLKRTFKRHNFDVMEDQMVINGNEDVKGISCIMCSFWFHYRCVKIDINFFQMI